MVGMAATASGNGYWLVASDGGIFSFGDARFFGSTGALRLDRPIVGMAATASGNGYWLVASDGGIFSFGDARFEGSGATFGQPVSGMVQAGPDAYWVVATSGTVEAFAAQSPSGGAPAAPSGATQPQPVPALPGGLMHLAFADEFNGPSLSSTWQTCWWYSLGGCSNGDQEAEWYAPSNVTVANGQLSLTALRQTVPGRQMTTGLPRTYQYTSGMVTSYGNFSFDYGYVEWRAQLPSGQGLWPALWLMPANNTWPPEIDALETVGSQPDVACWTYIQPNGAHSASYRDIPALSSGWHTFGVDWEPGVITWYVDGVAEFTTTSAVTSTPMYLVMDLAVGGTWAGLPNATTPFPSTLGIDYVRVWQH
jgi:beta-glucanase (GH16 family)